MTMSLTDRSDMSAGDARSLQKSRCGKPSRDKRHLITRLALLVEVPHPFNKSFVSLLKSILEINWLP